MKILRLCSDIFGILYLCHPKTKESVYEERFPDKLRVSQSLTESSGELRELYTLREQFVKVRKFLSTIQEGRISQSMQSLVVYQKAQSVIAKLTDEISAINDGIENVIQSAPEMDGNYQFLKKWNKNLDFNRVY